MKYLFFSLLIYSSLVVSAQQWTEVTNVPTNSSSGAGWPIVRAIGIDTAVVGNDSALFMTHNDGQVWTKINDSILESDWHNSKIGIGLNQLSATNKLQLTTNGGTTWNTIYNGRPRHFRFNNNGDILILGRIGFTSYFFIESSNLGQTWDTIPLPNNTSYSYDHTSIVYRNGDSLILRTDTAFLYNRLLKTVNSGLNWQSNVINGRLYISGLAAMDYNNILFTEDRNVFVSTNGGVNFQQKVVGPSGSFIDALSLHDTLVAVGCSTVTNGSEVIARSTDFFTTWTFDTILNYTNTSGVDELNLISPNYGWASGFGSIYKHNTLNVGLANVEEETIIINVYPNPFNTDLNLSWEKSKSFERLQLYGLNGKKVYETGLKQRTSSVQMKLDLPPAFYIGVLKGKERDVNFKVISH